MITEKEIEEKEKELNKLKYELERQKARKEKEEKARKYFDKHFNMDMSHDISGIDEYYGQLKCRFIDNFSINDKSYNEYLLKELRQDYVDWVKSDLEVLQNQYNLLLEQLKEETENDE